MITTTTYGSWLPGDPKRLEQSKLRMTGTPIFFTPVQQQTLFDSLQSACTEFHYDLTDASIESWHLHWLCHHGFDSVATIVVRLKNRMRQSLNIGRIWTEGYFDSMCFEPELIQTRRRYIARHPGCRMTDGKIVSR